MVPIPTVFIDFLSVVLFVLLVIFFLTHFASGSKPIAMPTMLSKLHKGFALVASVTKLY